MDQRSLLTYSEFSDMTGIPRQYITLLVNLCDLKVMRIKGSKAGKGLPPETQAELLKLMEKARTPVKPIPAGVES